MVRDSLTKILGLSHDGSHNTQIKDIRTGLITPNPYQPRKIFDPIHLNELSKSIQEYGIIQPLIVREKNGKYELVAGERRWRAAKMVGLKTVPAIVRELADKDMAEIALIENLQREDLNYFEEAEGYSRLIEEFNLTQDEIAKRVGKSQSTIANKLRLLKLSLDIKRQINVEMITERHARALLKLPSPEIQSEVLKKIYEEELTVRQTDMLIETIMGNAKIGNGKEESKSRIVRIFKDMRIYVNAIRSAVTAIKKAGLNVGMSETDCDDHVRIEIKIYKNEKKATRPDKQKCST